MSFLLDTNVVSELRKGKRCHAGLARWYATLQDADIFLSVLTLGEIRRGVERIRRRDPASAGVLEDWLARLLREHAERVLPVDARVADEWGRLNVPDPLPAVDGLLAATARVHDLTLATRDFGGVARTGVRLVNPFA